MRAPSHRSGKQLKLYQFIKRDQNQGRELQTCESQKPGFKSDGKVDQERDPLTFDKE